MKQQMSNMNTRKTKKKMPVISLVILLFVALYDIQSSNSLIRQLQMTDGGNSIEDHERLLSIDDKQLSSLRKTQALSPVIVTMVTPKTSLDDLCKSMKTLVNAQGSLTAPVLIFHLEDEPDDERKTFFRKCSDRPVYFPILDLDDFPVGFVPVPGKDYTEAQINRFWTTGIWNHPSLQPYDVIMRIDQATCISTPSYTLPQFKSPYFNYHSQYFPGTVEVNPLNLSGMFDYVQNYIAQNDLRLDQNVKMWQKVLNTHESVQSLPNFIKSFEVTRKSFMQREDVAAFHYALTDLPPYGYFTKEWNTSAERYLTSSIFGTRSSIDLSIVPGFIQKNLALGVTNDKICTTPFLDEE